MTDVHVKSACKRTWI